ncbi:MAG: hypothetical protein F9K28_07395, partial [Bacteroidetes bacterium]
MKTNSLVTICWVALMAWGMLFNETTAQVETYPNWTRALDWSPDGSKIALSTMEGSIQIFDSMEGQWISAWQANDGYPIALSWNPGSDRLAISEGYTVKIWKADGSLDRDFTGYQDFILPIVWSPDGSKIATISTESYPNVLIWDVETGDEVFSTQIPLAMSLDWSHDGQLLAIGGLGKIEVWDAQTFEWVQTWELDDLGLVTWVAWSPDDTLLASADGLNRQSYKARIWNGEAGQVTTNYGGHGDIINSLTWSPNGANIASASTDGTIHIWNARTGENLRIIQGNDRLFATDWSPDGTQLAYGDLNGDLVIIPISSDAVCAATQTISAGDLADFINAINTANSNPDADVIGLEAGTYMFTTAHIPLNALPVITSDITICSIEGATLTRQTGSPLFGFFEVSAGGNLTLDNLTLNGGDVGNDTGGALVNKGGTVTLNNVTFTNNHANTGGAIDNESGSLTLIDSTFENNQADYGGAIDNDTGSTLSISGSTFTSNTADLDGGAIHNDGGTLTVTDSTLTTNTAGRYGGALDNTGSATISGSTFSGNSASWSGGAVRNTNILTVNNGSVLENNAATLGENSEGWGGGVYNASGGTATLSGVTLSENEAIQGGGIRNHGDLILNENTQLTGNSASSRGGGIYNAGGTIQLTNSALLNNTATGDGGAIYTTSLGSQVTITGSTLSGNTAGASGGAIR